jgi:hypothetical protein
MSPYVWFALAMAAIVIVGLIVTGNLAATFNERSKSDLKAALEPLAQQLAGDVDVETASIEGHYHGQITKAQVVAGPGGMGRLFQTTFVEPAGGEAWKAVVTRPRDQQAAWDKTFEGTKEPVLSAKIFELLEALLPYPGWFELGYEPASGVLTLTRAMQSRRDIPVPERFARYLVTLEAAAQTNRSVQSGVGAG